MARVDVVPAWVRCPWCADLVCTLCKVHLYDCDCPDIEGWMEKGIDPYTEGGDPVFYRDAIEPHEEFEKD